MHHWPVTFRKVNVKVLEWDNQKDGKSFDLSHLDTDFSFSQYKIYGETEKDIETRVVKTILFETGWRIKNCKIVVTNED